MERRIAGTASGPASLYEMSMTRAAPAARARTRGPISSGGTGHRHRIQYRVGHPGRQGRPLPAADQPLQLLLQSAPTVVIEKDPIGRGGSVKSDLRPSPFPRTGQPVLAVAARDDELADDFDLVHPATRSGGTGAKRRKRHLVEERPGMKRVNDPPVRHLSGHFDHAGTEARQMHRRRPRRAWPRAQKRGHQVVPVKASLEAQRRPLVPAPPDGPQRGHVFSHARVRMRPSFSEAALDVTAHLRAQTENEAPLREQLQVVGLIGADHRVARKSDGDGRCEADPGGGPRGQRQRQKRIVRPLEGEGAVEAGAFQRRCVLAGAPQFGRQQRRIHRRPAVPLHPPQPFRHHAAAMRG